MNIDVNMLARCKIVELYLYSEKNKESKHVALMKQQRLFTVVETGENNIQNIDRTSLFVRLSLLTSCNSIDG